MAKSVHKVNKALWKKWSNEEQAWFNRMWYNMWPGVLPYGVTMTQRQFNVLRYNVCFTLAAMMRQWRMRK